MFLPWSFSRFKRSNPSSKKTRSTPTSTKRTVDLIKSGLIAHGFTSLVISVSPKFFLHSDSFSFALWQASSWSSASKRTTQLLEFGIWSWESLNGGRHRLCCFVLLPSSGQTLADPRSVTRNILDLIGSLILTGEMRAVSSPITRLLLIQLPTLSSNWPVLSAKMKFCLFHLLAILSGRLSV